MNIVKVNLRKRAYDILIAGNATLQLGRFVLRLGIGNAAFIITNPSIKKLHGLALERTLKNCGFETKFKLIPDSEKSKSIETASSVIRELVAYDKNRRVFIVAFGGGVIGDLAGFVASVYKRGCPYIQVPTTLLAQVDSSIGGKTAVDLAQGKNLVGAFYQPRLVCSDTAFLKTLNTRQVRNGLAEAIKYGIIKDPSLFAYLEKKYIDVLSLRMAALEHVVKKCSSIKAKVVGRDEREEKGYRTCLNFGHTIGHAIETAAGYTRYSHGEAVAIGMLVASDISRRLGLAPAAACARIERLLKAVGLPVRIKGISARKIINASYHDKKSRGRKNRFVLIRGIGETKIKEDIPLPIIKEALESRI